MSSKEILLVCATLSCFYFAAVFTQAGTGTIPVTRFTCRGRAAGYYADMETGCQVYHMCDGLGRQFSYTCPNTTLFQQRMLICDHWYMVNCSKSESDYDANLLIGQRDKPFVSEEEMRQRTPRPDILSVPPNSNYYEGLKQAETKVQFHPGNSIVGIVDTLSNNNNGLDSDKQTYRPPNTWSTGTGSSSHHQVTQQDDITGAASHNTAPTFQPATERNFASSTRVPRVSSPSPDLSLPLLPITTTTESPTSAEFDLDLRMNPASSEDTVINFIKRFDPNSPDRHNTAMTQSEIININHQLPAGQASSEEERTPRKNNNEGNFNNFQNSNDKNFSQRSRFDTVNVKPTFATESTPTTTTVAATSTDYPTPSRELVPPKSEFSAQPSTTMGPPVYFEWKWAVPAFDLEPPKESNATDASEAPKSNIQGRSPFSSVTRRTVNVDTQPKNTEYNTSSYFVPDYVFPLDSPHPSYENAEAQTSFQVKVSRPGRASYGENPACPHCHPAYLQPGTCEPCIVKR